MATAELSALDDLMEFLHYQNLFFGSLFGKYICKKLLIVGIKGKLLPRFTFDYGEQKIEEHRYYELPNHFMVLRIKRLGKESLSIRLNLKPVISSSKKQRVKETIAGYTKMACTTGK